MSTRRVRSHKRDAFLDVKARKFWKIFDQEGLMHKDIRKFADRPRKFRKRAYHHEKKLEDEIMKKKAQQSLKTEPLGLLRFVKAPFEQSRYKDIFRGSVDYGRTKKATETRA